MRAFEVNACHSRSGAGLTRIERLTFGTFLSGFMRLLLHVRVMRSGRRERWPVLPMRDQTFSWQAPTAIPYLAKVGQDSIGVDANRWSRS